MKILAIETSCDETAAAVVEDGTKVLSSVVASSGEFHQKYGGIVPEVAAREQLRCIIPVIEESLAPLKSNKLNNSSIVRTIELCVDAIAITVGPGLIGSLLVGVETAKTIVFATGKPIIPVNHVLAHIYANFVNRQPSNINKQQNNLAMQQFKSTTIEFPSVCLVVSGGHTELYLMKSIKHLKWLGGTLDDAAGECFDKAARLLGFGSRGGLAIQEAANKFKILNLKFQIKLPRPLIHADNLNFSFSGLKTAILREVNKLEKEKQYNNATIKQLAFELQEAITDVLVTKTLRAAEIYHAKSILLGGGVAANLKLREKFSSAIQQYNNITIHFPPPSLCTDNATYLGSYAFFRGKPVDWHKVTAIPDLSVEV